MKFLLIKRNKLKLQWGGTAIKYINQMKLFQYQVNSGFGALPRMNTMNF